MFERFTNQSRRAVVLAQEEARMLSQNYIGPEHLLLGLLHEGRGSAAQVLAEMGITLDAARDQVVTATGRGQGQLSGHIPFTPEAKKSLELSLRDATALENYYISTGHLLLGLLSQGDNLALEVLGRLGADLAELPTRVTREVLEHPEQGEGAPLTTEQQLTRGRGETRPRVLAGVLAAIEERLTAIERQLGITSSSDGPGEPPAAAG